MNDLLVLDYCLTPRSRISAGRSAEAGNTRNIHEVIPGTTIRGALGGAWWAGAAPFTGHDASGAFEEMFSQRLRIGPAIPSRGGVSARLRPLSEVKCKYPTTTNCIEDWLDTAMTHVDLSECRGCGGGLERGRGWTLGGDDEKAPWVVSVTRTELENGIAKDEQLFTRKALRKDLVLHGQIRLTTSGLDSDVSRTVTEWLTTPRPLSIGGQLSVLGRCDWTCQQASNAASSAAASGTYAIQLTSPAILLDEWGAANLDLKCAIEAIISDVGGEGDVECRPAWTRPIVVSGWHGMAGLPKPEEWALSAGSVAVVTGADAATVAALREGVGIRRVEGYGTVRLVAVGGIDTAPTAGDADPTMTVEVGKREVPTETEAPDEVPQPALAHLRKVLNLVPLDKQAATVSQILSQSREMQRLRSSALSATELATRARMWKSKPWMRILAGITQDEIVALWGSPDLASYIAALEHLEGGRS